MRDYIGIAWQYEADVLSGRVSACRRVQQACRRNIKDRARAGKRSFPFVFDEARAIDACQCIEQMPHVKGSLFARVIGRWPDGSPRWNTLHLEPWQVWIVCCIFGWLHAKTRFRRFRTALILVPRKNGKSFLAAAILLYLFACDYEAGAETYSAATKEDQAALVSKTAIQMVRREPQFREHFGIVEYRDHLEIPAVGSELKALGADAHTLDGLNPHGIVIDELHAHRTRAVWDVIETAEGARAQPLIFAISTAGNNTGGICYEQLTYLHKLLDGSLSDETFFGVEYTLDPEDLDRWWTREALQKANPNFGVSVNADALVARARKARHTPAATAAFMTKRLNVWTGTEAPWVSVDEWGKCKNQKLKIEDCAGLPCRVAVDLAEIRDIASIAITFERPDGGVAVFARHYLPEDSVEASPIAQMGGWVRTGHLIATEGNIVDYQRIEDDIVTWVETYQAREVVFDVARASRMMQNLQKRLGDTNNDRVIVVPQTGKAISPAFVFLEELILDERLQHDGDPVLAWMVSNVVVHIDQYGQPTPRKQGGKMSPHKIDGVLAVIYTLVRYLAVAAEPPPPPSAAEDENYELEVTPW